ncbi:hypothetical protein CAPTEDRAFT_219142 [Capitella teleta]|uniref:RRM domain-containing protein n=1 Tax=Capitella teleta TaxID=283909 RepID=R7UBB2_CAPTE|nr:hypothetical protein CAPTEDRAFT_219142 [Capitella teleta]|eukprot:ELU03655.1 hypothetical protein CAPTEDRAFT_219142 [Capitella teleta]
MSIQLPESGKSRGIGFVTFSTFEDAKEALDTVKKVNGQQILSEYAKKRETEKRKKGARDDSEKQSDDENDEEKPTKSKKPKRFQAPLDPMKCRVTINGLPLSATERQIEKAATAAKVTENVFIDRRISGQKIRAVHGVATQASPSSKVSRIIVRNLSFKCTEDILREKFQKFGKILEVKIPLKGDKAKNTMKGFAFVQFETVEEAQAALEMNAQQILNRPVAVDWCIGKTKFVQANVASVKEAKEDSTIEKTVNKEKKKKEKKKIENGGMKVYNYGEGMIPGGEDDKNEKEDEEVEEDESESEEEEDEESEEMEESEQEVEEEEEVDSDDEMEIEEDDSNDNDDDEDEDVSDEKEGKTKTKKKDVSGKSDTEEGRTLFVRNLSFESEEEDMYELFSELGDVVYCRITMNKETGKSRGTGFVQYSSKEDADKCLEVANDPGPNGGLMLDERELKVSVALSKDKVGKVVEKRKESEKEKPDKRNLQLAREGLIRAGTKDAEGVSATDMAKRQKLQMVFRTKLKNDNIFISPTRICIHNLPPTLEDAKLKKLIFRQIKEPLAKITECRVMRDMDRLNTAGKGKSRGYAFVNFEAHEHALKALRTLNNNPAVFTDIKRPIVEFSLENKLVLTAKQKRQDRSKAKAEALTTGQGVYTDKKKKEKKEKKEAVVALAPAPSSGVVAEMKKLKKGLPSHWGPKIRHKARTPQVTAPKKKEKKIRTTAIKEDGGTVPAKKGKSSRKKGAASSDDIDVLIGKYKNSISSSINAKKKKSDSKWFD